VPDGRADPGQPRRAAIRLSLSGRHDGPGPFGPRGAAAPHGMGIPHADFGPRGLRPEWTPIEQTAIGKRIPLAAGRV